MSYLYLTSFINFPIVKNLYFLKEYNIYLFRFIVFLELYTALPKKKLLKNLANKVLFVILLIAKLI